VARRGSPTIVEILILVAVGGIIISIFRGAIKESSPPATADTEAGAAESEAAKAESALTARLTPPAGTVWKDGLAAIVLVDVSGSMHDRIKGERRRKIEAAQAAVNDLIGAFAKYAAANPAQPVLLGIHEFSARNGQPAARVVLPLGKPDPATAAGAIAGIKTGGGTPIGDAMVEARLALDRSGLKRRHLLVVTDGENTDGIEPPLVARVFEQQNDELRASTYFVAFDVDAEAFAGVKAAGSLLLSAKSGAELASTFDELLSDRIFVEAPRTEIEAARPAGAAAPAPPR
jgi:Mg-chelatase subunit ChlD